MNWSYVAGFFDGEGCVSLRYRNRMKSRRQKQLAISLLFANSNRTSLREMQRFVGCGAIYLSNRRSPKHKAVFNLNISRWRDVLRVAEKMLPHSIIKRHALTHLIATVKTHDWDKWGELETISADSIRKLYHEEGLSIQQLADKFGVTFGAVQHKMVKHGIPRRTDSEAIRLKYSNGWHREAKPT